MNIAFMSSYNGSSAKAITDACLNDDIIASPTLMISNNSDSNALVWAKERGLKTLCLNSKTHEDPEKLDEAIAERLREERINLLVLSGYMKLVGSETLEAVDGRALNIHPALLPNYGGKGMYGRHVHQAVKDANESQTGITIHRVSPIYDDGDIVSQKIISLTPTDSVDDIENKVRSAEPEFYVETIQKILKKEISF